MTRLFRSKSLNATSTITSTTTSLPFCRLSVNEGDQEEEEKQKDQQQQKQQQQQQQYPQVLALLAAALRKSLVTCSAERDDVADSSSSSSSSSLVDIGGPTDVHHVSHVTFDRFDGFLGLPGDFQPQLPSRVPSASASVFGVSAESMQCSYDLRGNSVPTILLMLQKRLYAAGGLQTEGIFRINAENDQEEHVRNELNKGIVLHGIDVHCLTGLIKAWFRELPTGVLDSLKPEQLMRCNTEDDCIELMKLLPSTEAALLDWAINLMADVVQQEHHNKMNARNIAMVFAPNMTQMADPLTALIHAVQVMNFLKTLILKTLREREESGPKARLLSSCLGSPRYKGGSHPSVVDPNITTSTACCQNLDGHEGEGLSIYSVRKIAYSDVLRLDSEENHSDKIAGNHDPKKHAFRSPYRITFSDRLQLDSESILSSQKSSCIDEGFEGDLASISSVTYTKGTSEPDYEAGYDAREVGGKCRKLRLRKGVRKLCRHSVFQMSKPVKNRSRDDEIGTPKGGGGEAWA